MKKFLKVTGITLLVILVLLIVIPLSVKDKLSGVVVNQASKYLNAEVGLESVSVSLLRNFPNATVTLRGLEVVGRDDFSADTLLSADRLLMTINLGSLFSGKGYDIVRVDFRDVDVRGVVLEDGRQNWDILTTNGKEEVEKPYDPEEPDYVNVLLEKLIFRNLNASFDDRQNKMYAAAKGLEMQLSGNMTLERTTLKLDMSVASLDFRYGGIPYLSRAAISLRSDLDVETNEKRFTFKDNEFSLNAIRASFDGWAAIAGEEGYDLDLRLVTGNTDFREILSLIPAVYAKDFKDLKASGNASLGLWAKGRLSENLLPAFEASVKVKDGSFRYPSLPKGVENIHIDASAANPGGAADLTVVNVENLRFSMGGNPFGASARVATPVSDPDFNVSATGVLDLAMIEEVYPLEEMNLSGRLDADFSVKGRLSSLERGDYHNVAASGSLKVSDMLIATADMPDVQVDRAVLAFSPRYVQLSETSVRIGRSDIAADCSLENYMGFLLKGTTIKGTLNVRSALLDVNELTGAESVPAETAGEEQSAFTAPEIPKNVEFDMNVSLGKVYFSNLELDNVKGRVVVSGGKLDMRNLELKALGGGVVANGYYSTANGISSPELNAHFAMTGLSFRSTFSTFLTVRKLAPVFESLDGNYSGNLALDTKLDSLLNPRYETMFGKGTISTRNVNLSGMKVIDKIADAVGKPDLKNLSVKDMNLKFAIDKGRITTEPFDLKMGDYALNLSGSTGLDQTIDYKGKISLPASTGIGKYTTLDMKIGGTFDSPTVGVDLKGMAEQAAEEVVSNLLENVGEKLGIDISDAQKQRDALIAEARKAGDKLVQEAERQAEKLMEEAGDNKLKQIGARTAGNKLIEAAQKSADNLVKKAEEQGDKLVEAAAGK